MGHSSFLKKRGGTTCPIHCDQSAVATVKTISLVLHDGQDRETPLSRGDETELRGSAQTEFGLRGNGGVWERFWRRSFSRWGSSSSSGTFPGVWQVGKVVAFLGTRSQAPAWERTPRSSASHPSSRADSLAKDTLEPELPCAACPKAAIQKQLPNRLD